MRQTGWYSYGCPLVIDDRSLFLPGSGWGEDTLSGSNMSARTRWFSPSRPVVVATGLSRGRPRSASPLGDSARPLHGISAPSSKRKNLSPFTKDFRGGGALKEFSRVFLTGPSLRSRANNLTSRPILNDGQTVARLKDRGSGIRP